VRAVQSNQSERSGFRNCRQNSGHLKAALVHPGQLVIDSGSSHSNNEINKPEKIAELGPLLKTQPTPEVGPLRAMTDLLEGGL
jgi:hypothetical protein